MTMALSKLTHTLAKTTNETAKYQTSLRLLKTTLGDTTETATKFINKLSEMSGIDETTLTRQTSKFVQLGKSFNLSTQEAEKFSEQLSIVTTKLALLYNMDYTKMASNVQKAMQGTQTTLKATTGISANSMSEQATLTAYGIDRLVSSLNDAELSIVKYATILRQVTSDNKVYQEAVNSLAWQKQILKSQVQRLATAIGSLLTPAFTTLYTVINGVLMVITELVSMLAKLVGIDIKAVSSAGDLADNYDDLSNAIGGASATAKKSLRSFDKLNNITTPSSRRWWSWRSFRN